MRIPRKIDINLRYDPRFPPNFPFWADLRGHIPQNRPNRLKFPSPKTTQNDQFGIGPLWALWGVLIYLAFLALQFVLALGNRPKGERMAYALTLWVYAFLAVYLLVCSIFLTVKAFAVSISDTLCHVCKLMLYVGSPRRVERQEHVRGY